MSELPQTIAIGRPVSARHPYAAGWPRFDDSAKVICTECNSEAWFGPRQQKVIATGTVRPVCADCLIDMMVAGERPAGIMSLGNPGQAEVEWQDEEGRNAMD